jgi:hypothetical protein
MLIASVAGNAMREREVIRDIHLFILSFEAAVEAGYHSEQAEDFRAQLGAEVGNEMTRAAAAALLPWVEALAAYLREAQAEDEEQWVGAVEP